MSWLAKVIESVNYISGVVARATERCDWRIADKVTGFALHQIETSEVQGGDGIRTGPASGGSW